VKLNRIEKALMNNPIRALVQRHHEAALMQRLGGRLDGMRVLEVGCGWGVGTEIIFERFGAREVHAFDLDPDMVEKARKRLSRYPAPRLRLFVGTRQRSRPRMSRTTQWLTSASFTMFRAGKAL